MGCRFVLHLDGADWALAPDAGERHDLTPETITAFMVGLKSRLATFQLQRQINTYTGEPLLAILPGVTLTQLWQMMAVMENTLRLISSLVLLASLLVLAAMLLASIRERQREIAVMRIIGASPWFLLTLIETEATDYPRRYTAGHGASQPLHRALKQSARRTVQPVY